jgi:hypothetical protein
LVLRSEWTSSELQCDCASSIDKQVKPTIFPGQGKAFKVQAGANAHTNQAHTRRGHDSTPDDSGAAEKLNIQISTKF